MRTDDGCHLGWGVAIGAYPNTIVPVIARLAVTDEGEVAIRIGGHEMGQGIRTAVAAVVARKLGVPASQVTIHLGDTRAAPQHNTAGSWGTASAVPVASELADAMRRALDGLTRDGRAGRTPAEVLRAAGQKRLEIEGRRTAPGQSEEAFDRLKNGQLAVAGPVFPEFATFSYVAHFVEVTVEPSTRRVRVPRVVSVVDCGRVMSPRTAASQVRSGVVWGISAALRETDEIDPRYGGVINADLAEYVIAVNADIGSIDVDFIDEPDDSFNPDGVKCLGEVVLTGVAPAVANAIHHATGRRLRDLPIRIEALL